MDKWLILVWAHAWTRIRPRWYVHSLHDTRPLSCDAFDALPVPPCYDGLCLLKWSFRDGLMPVAAKAAFEGPADAYCDVFISIDNDPSLTQAIEALVKLEWKAPSPLPVSPAREDFRDRSVP